MAKPKVRITGFEETLKQVAAKAVPEDDTAKGLGQAIVDEVYELHSGDPVEVIREALRARGVTGNVDDIAEQISRGERPVVASDVVVDDKG